MKYLLNCGALSARADPMGGELVSLHDAQGRERIWQGDPKVWTGRNPILFPIVGRLREDRVLIHGAPYEMPQHGFARRREFEVLQSRADFLEFGLSADAQTRAAYPYAFSLRVRHRLLPDGFETVFTVENRGEGSMPFCIGAHTAFVCPLSPEEYFEDYILEFSEEEDTAAIPIGPSGILLPQRKNLPLRGRTLPLNYAFFDEKDTLIFEGLRSSHVALRNVRTGQGVRVDVFGWPMLAFWTKPGAHAPYLCIEPWQGCADCEGESGRFQDKRHCVTLEGGGVWQRAYRVTLL